MELDPEKLKIRQEREELELCQLKLEAGLIGSREAQLKMERMEWMYENPAEKQKELEQEAFLLGRKIDETKKDVQQIRQLGSELPGSLFLPSVAKADEDALRKLREDPLFIIKQAEHRHRQAIATNPVIQQRLKEQEKREEEERERKIREEEKKAERKEAKRREKERKKEAKHRQKEETRKVKPQREHNHSGSPPRHSRREMGSRSRSRSARRLSESPRHKARPGRRSSRSPRRDGRHRSSSRSLERTRRRELPPRREGVEVRREERRRSTDREDVRRREREREEEGLAERYHRRREDERRRGGEVDRRRGVDTRRTDERRRGGGGGGERREEEDKRRHRRSESNSVTARVKRRRRDVSRAPSRIVPGRRNASSETSSPRDTRRRTRDEEEGDAEHLRKKYKELVKRAEASDVHEDKKERSEEEEKRKMERRIDADDDHEKKEAKPLLEEPSRILGPVMPQSLRAARTTRRDRSSDSEESSDDDGNARTDVDGVDGRGKEAADKGQGEEQEEEEDAKGGLGPPRAMVAGVQKRREATVAAGAPVWRPTGRKQASILRKLVVEPKDEGSRKKPTTEEERQELIKQMLEDGKRHEADKDFRIKDVEVKDKLMTRLEEKMRAKNIEGGDIYLRKLNKNILMQEGADIDDRIRQQNARKYRKLAEDEL